MKMKIGKMIYGGLVLGLLLGASGAEAVVPCNDGTTYPACGTGTTVERWRCWEKTLTSTGSYVNGSRDVKLKVTYELSGHPTATYTSFAFWDGKNGTNDTFRLRTSFSSNGRWFWTTTCDSGCAPGETGLVQTGYVDVTTPTAHPLYSNGRLKQFVFNNTSVNPTERTHRPIEHHNGAPFLWQGDTAWAATLRACRQNWKDYVDNRRNKGFTVIHLGLAMDWGGPPSAGGPKNIRNQAPFEQLPGDIIPQGAKVPNNRSRMNPLFWRELDGMVQYANDKGIVIFITGLIEPVTRWPETAEARIFARNLVARLAGNFVIYSPGFDNGFDGNLLDRVRQVASEVQTTSRWHLLTNHFSFTVPDANLDDLHADTWLAFEMLQSGHNDNNLALITGRPYDKTQLLRGFTGVTTLTSTRKPVINGEAVYDHNFDSAGTNYFNAYRARQTGWLSWLSGTVGYSYGAAGIWEWMVCAETFAPSWCGSTGVPQTPGGWVSYQTSMNWASATHMQYMANLLRTVDWWNLNANEQSTRVTNQAATPQQRMVTARDPDTLLAYMPHNSEIKINLNGTNLSHRTARMFNPRLGGDQAVAGTLQTDGSYRFSNPNGLGAVGGDDWVLVIRQSSSDQMVWAGATDNLIEVWPQTGNAETGPGIYGQIVDPDARIAAEVFQVSDTAATRVRKPAAARDGAGNFLVVWEQEAAPDDLPQIVARRFDSAGNPLGSSFLVAADPDVAQLRPSVAMDSLGRAFVVWQERDGDGTSRVLGQLMTAAGMLSGAPFAIDSPLFSGEVVSAQGAPRVACAPGGTCLTAWELTDADTGERTVRARRYNVTGAPAGLSFQVNAQPQADVWLQRVIMDAGGNPDVAWEELDSAGDSLGAWLQEYDSSGAPVGAAQAWNGSSM